MALKDHIPRRDFQRFCNFFERKPRGFERCGDESKLTHLDSQPPNHPPIFQVELLTPTNRVSLFDKTIPHMDPEAFEDRLVNYEVKELGDHRYMDMAWGP